MRLEIETDNWKQIANFIYAIVIGNVANIESIEYKIEEYCQLNYIP